MGVISGKWVRTDDADFFDFGLIIETFGTGFGAADTTVTGYFIEVDGKWSIAMFADSGSEFGRIGHGNLFFVYVI